MECDRAVLSILLYTAGRCVFSDGYNAKFSACIVDISQNKAVYVGTLFCSSSLPSAGYWCRVLRVHSAFHVSTHFFEVHVVIVLSIYAIIRFV